MNTSADLHIDVAHGRAVFWAHWVWRGHHTAVADTLAELRRLLPRGRRLQLVDQDCQPATLVVVPVIEVAK